MEIPPTEALAEDLYILKDSVSRFGSSTMNDEEYEELQDVLRYHVDEMNEQNNVDRYGLYNRYGNENGRMLLREILDKAELIPFYDDVERSNHVRNLINSIDNIANKFDAVYIPPRLSVYHQMRSYRNTVKRSRKVKRSVKRSAKKSVKRSRKVKRSAKKSVKRTAKSSAKKSVKRTAKRSAKKSVKRAAKRSAKKSVKRTAKRSAKKSVKRTAKRSAKKSVRKTRK